MALMPVYHNPRRAGFCQLRNCLVWSTGSPKEIQQHRVFKDCWDNEWILKTSILNLRADRDITLRRREDGGQ